MEESIQNETPEELLIKKILKETKVIAIVGMSRYPEKEAYTVPLYLLAQGYTVIPVNPFADEIVGLKSYKTLSDIPEPVDLVTIFRPSNQVLPFVQEALDIGAKTIWLQEGISNLEAFRMACARNVLCVMDRCIYKEHTKLVMSR